MKIEGKITILINHDYTMIEIEDENANMKFVTIKLTPEQLSAVLSRQVCVDCELDIKGLDKVGKKHENKRFVFEIPEGLKYDRYGRDGSTKLLAQYAQTLLTDGWIAEDYFGSQDSFFDIKGKKMAGCVIRRWV